MFYALFFYNNGMIRTLAIKCANENLFECSMKARALMGNNWKEVGHSNLSPNLFEIWQGEKVIF
jgi:hypothetical protein